MKSVIKTWLLKPKDKNNKKKRIWEAKNIKKNTNKLDFPIVTVDSMVVTPFSFM